MSLVLTILRREVMALPRRKRFYLKRTAFVVLGASVIIWGFSVARATGATTIGLQVFIPLAMSALVGMGVVQAINASSLVTREKEERTFGLLFLSDISHWSFLLGKLFTSLFATSMTLLSVLPLFMLTVSLGGISATQVLTAFAVVVSTSVFLACLGIFVATLVRAERAVNGLLVLIAVGLYGLLPAVITLVCVTNDMPVPDEVLCALSPFGTMATLIQGQMIAWGVVNCCLSILLGLLVLCLARAVLPSKIFSREKRPLGQVLREAARSIRATRKWARPGRIKGNPVAWKDIYYGYGGKRAIWMKFLLSCTVIATIVMCICLHERQSWRDIRDMLHYLFFFLFAAVVGLGSLSGFGVAFNRERKSRAVDVLLTTSLTDREIVWGKIEAVMMSLSPWLIGLLTCCFISIAKSGHRSWFWEGASVVAFEYVSMWFGYSCLALWLSVRYRRNVAFPVCMLCIVLYNSLGRMIVMSAGAFSLEPEMIVIFDVFVQVAFGVVFLGMVFSDVRRMALRDHG